MSITKISVKRAVLGWELGSDGGWYTHQTKNLHIYATLFAATKDASTSTSPNNFVAQQHLFRPRLLLTKTMIAGYILWFCLLEYRVEKNTGTDGIFLDSLETRESVSFGLLQNGSNAGYFIGLVISDNYHLC